MKADGMYPQLFENDTAKSKFWFAGLTSKGDDDSFGITAAWAGVVGDKHGPEFAYGNRLQELTGNRILIFKCVETCPTALGRTGTLGRRCAAVPELTPAPNAWPHAVPAA